MEKTYIKQIDEKEMTVFYPWIAEIEIGSLYDETNEKHLAWLQDKVKTRFGSGTVFFGMYAQDGTPIGIAGVQLEKTLEGVPYLGNKSELMDIVIAEKYRNKGYGTELLKYAENTAKEHGAYCMYAATTAFDSETVFFYGKNGFVPVATLVDVNGPGEEGALYMRKVL